MPKKQRITRADFSTLSQVRQRRLSGVYFSASVSCEGSVGSALPRYACVVSKKVAAHAVDRNLIKRYCREACRLLTTDTPSRCSFVFFAKKEAKGASFQEIQHDVKNLFEQSKLLSR